MYFQCTKHSKWSYLCYIFWKYDKCALARPFDWDLFKIVKTYHVHYHSRTWWKRKKIESDLAYGRIFTENTVIVNWLGFKFSKDKKQEVLTRGSTILRQGKSYIDNNLNLTKANVIDTINDNFAEPLIIKEVLDD